MTDVFSKEKRSSIMRQVPSKNTTLELKVRSLVHRMGYCFRLHRSDLPGKPDLVFPSRRKVIFVHGCFWHGHTCARGSRIPKTNSDYWINKISKNLVRDTKHHVELQSLFWKVLTIWECEIKDIDLLEPKIKLFLES